ncbi:MAG: sporulation protein YunB [Clostridia bacterium]|nr:sporulation protein YunB [Clostridia bacterium]
MRLGIVSVRKKGDRCKRLAFVLLALILLTLWAGMKIRPIIVSVAKGYGENVVANNLNEIINKELKNIDFDFTRIVYTPEGTVASVGMDSHKVNLFMTDIVLMLKDKIIELEEIEAKIPLGNFLSNPFFSGLGPSVPVKFLILANTNVTAEDKFVSEGINQTLYTINLRVDTKVGIYIPGIKDSMTVTNIVPISQHLIVGEVPDSYTNVEGMEGTVQDTVLDIE